MRWYSRSAALLMALASLSLAQEAPDPFPGQRGSLGLKASNGLRQERQKWVDRHNVGPNALSSTVSSLPQ